MYKQIKTVFSIFIFSFILLSSVSSQNTTITCYDNAIIDKRKNVVRTTGNEVFSGVIIEKPNKKPLKIYSPFKVKFISSRKVDIRDAYGNISQISIKSIIEHNTKSKFIAFVEGCSGSSGGGLVDGDYGSVSIQNDGTSISYNDGMLQSAHLATGVVTSTKIGTDAVGAQHITDDAIRNYHVLNAELTSAKLAQTGVTAGSYTNSDLTINAQGQITFAADGSGGGSSSFKGVHESLDSANVNGVSNTEGDYVLIYDVGAYTFEEGDLVRFYENPSTLGDSIRSIWSGVGLYSTTTLGIAATSPNDYFHVTGDGGSTFTGYINSSGSPFATGATGNILPVYDARNSGGLLVPYSADETVYNTATYHNGEYKFFTSGYKGQFTSLAEANNTIRNHEGDYVSIVKEGSGYTFSEGMIMTVYSNPSGSGTSENGTYTDRPMYSTTTVGQANTSSSEYYLTQETETTFNVYQNFGGANFSSNGTIKIEYDASHSGLLAVPQSGVNLGADFGFATFTNGSFQFTHALRISEAERDLLTAVDGLEVYCVDCLDEGGVNAGVKQVYQLSTTSWKNLY